MVASPYLLHKIGLKFARSVLNKNLNPEQKLWREVVINAFDETLIVQSDRKSSLIKISAHNWIIGGDKDFKQVCEWGTLDPEDMQDCYARALKKRQVSFSQRQVAWKEYDKLYKRMISEDNKIVRKIKRKEVDDFRKKVKSIPDTLISTIILSVFV
tara:strand:- start:67 stop:534 length:468 start_codon:yes stop_codon:yes gene_type:complete